MLIIFWYAMDSVIECLHFFQTLGTGRLFNNISNCSLIPLLFSEAFTDRRTCIVYVYVFFQRLTSAPLAHAFWKGISMHSRWSNLIAQLRFLFYLSSRPLLKVIIMAKSVRILCLFFQCMTFLHDLYHVVIQYVKQRLGRQLLQAIEGQHFATMTGSA